MKFRGRPTQHGRAGHQHQGTQGERWQQAHHNTQNRQQSHWGFHSPRRLVGVRVGQVTRVPIEKGIVNETRRIGHAAQRRQGRQGRYQPAPAAHFAECHGFRQEHLL